MQLSEWHHIAINEWDAKFYTSMEKGKVYLYEAYTPFFVEFKTREQAEKFREHIESSEENQPECRLVLIDTRKPDICNLWRRFVK